MLELRLRSLIASLAVRTEAWVLDEPVALLDAGEWGLAFEALCDNVYDAEMKVFPGEVVEIESIGAQLGSTRRSWRLVRELLVAEN